MKSRAMLCCSSTILMGLLFFGDYESSLTGEPARLLFAFER